MDVRIETEQGRESGRERVCMGIRARTWRPQTERKKRVYGTTSFFFFFGCDDNLRSDCMYKANCTSLDAKCVRAVGSPSHTRVTQASFLTPGGKQGRHLVSGRTSTLSSDLFWKDGVTDDGVPRWQNVVGVVGVVGATPFTPTETRHHD